MGSSSGLIGSSLSALSTQYRGLTHNLANANTTGFKKRRSLFAQALDKQTGASSSAPGARSGKIQETSIIDFSQGALTRTGRPLDVAISGEGLFVIETSSGPLYTRNGTFTTNDRGQIVDSAGRTVAGTGGPIILPAGASASQVSISSDGQVSANGQVIGSLRIVEFKDKTLLTPAGQGTFRADPGAQPGVPEEISVQQRFQESSNVSVVEELVDLITVTRMYEANLRSMSAKDDQTEHILNVAMG
jgi:flagellar basal-body rod protein FlgF